MPDSKAQELCKQAKMVQGERSNFESFWQTLHDYFYLEADNITKTYYPGTELSFDYLFDTFSLNSADVLAAGLTNYLTPPTSKWFALRTKDPRRMESKAVANFLQDASAEIYHTFNRSNFYNQITPGYKSSGVYGTMTILEEEDLQDGVRFYDLPIKQVGLVKDARGRIHEYYIEFKYSTTEAVTRFGIENVGKKIKKTFEKGDRGVNKKWPFLLYLGPRYERDETKEDALNMPIKACWINVDDEVIVKESGYLSMPAFTHRFYTQSETPYGFSPAMKTLADVRWLNVMKKTMLRGAMKVSDPPIALPHNSFILPFNSNPRALNYYKANAKFTKDSIFPIGNYANVNVNKEMTDDQKQAIKDHMFYDVFLSFRGLTKQMNVPEVMARKAEQMTLLGPSVGRFLSDVGGPIIERTFDILARQGRMPDPPDELLEDPRYEIEYTSALALAQKNTDLNALQNSLALAAEMANYNPAVLDKIDFDKALDVTWGITGADVSVLRDEMEVAEIRETRALAAQAEQEKINLMDNVQIAKTGSEAARNVQQGAA